MTRMGVSKLPSSFVFPFTSRRASFRAFRPPKRHKHVHAVLECTEKVSRGTKRGSWRAKKKRVFPANALASSPVAAREEKKKTKNSLTLFALVCARTPSHSKTRYGEEALAVKLAESEEIWRGIVAC